VWHYLRGPMFSRFDTIPECDGHTHTHHTHTHTQTDGHKTTAYTALSIASRGKNRPTVHYRSSDKNDKLITNNVKKMSL